MPDSEKNNSSDGKDKLSPGDVMKAVIRSSEGDLTPKKGDLVIFHYTTRTTSGVIVESTRHEYGGNDVPKKLVLNKSKMIRGWEEGIPTISKGEIAMLKVKPEFHYGDKQFQGTVPDDYPKNEELTFEIELIDFFPVKVVADDLGVLKRVLSEGEGWENPRPPYEVRVWLRWKTDREDDFKSLKTDEPFHFILGKQQMLAGLESGICTMTKNEKSIIMVSKNHLTGKSLIPEMPKEFEEIHFEVEMVQIIQVRDLVGDGQVIKRRIKDGRGDFPMDCPLQDSVMRIHYKGSLPEHGGVVFYDSRRDHEGGEPITFGSDEGLVPEGLEMCVKLMLPGEVAMVTSTSEYAYDKFPRPERVPEGATVQWEVELIDFEKAKDWSDFTFQEIMDDAENIRATGNRLFKEGKYNLAKGKYEKVLREFNHVNPQNDDEGKIFVQTRYLLHLNVAACYQKLGEHVRAIETCNKVLDENPSHVKALYRRGMSYMAVGDFDEARADFNAMIASDKSAEPDAKAALAKLKKQQLESETQAKKQFKGLFDKKPGELSQVDEAESNHKSNDDKDKPRESSEPEDGDSKEAGSPKPRLDENHMGSTSRLLQGWRHWFKGFSTRCSVL